MLPSKANIIQLIAKVENTFKYEIDSFKEKTTHLGTRLEAVETSHEEMWQTIKHLKTLIKARFTNRGIDLSGR